MIGIYDSGSSALLLADLLAHRAQGQRLLVYADTTPMSLAAEPPEHVIERCRSGFRYLAEHGADLILIACHDAGALAVPTVQSEFMVKIHDVVSASMNVLNARISKARIGVIGSRTLIASDSYRRRVRALSADAVVFSKACPLLVPLIDECWFNRPETKRIINSCLRPLKDQQIDTLLPACSRYQQLLPMLAARAGRRTRTIDPFTALVEQALPDIARLPDDAPPQSLRPRVHVTRQTTETDQAIARMLGRSIDRWEIS